MVNQITRGELDLEAFRRFVADAEPKIRQALSASLGSEPGKDATADALEYAWQHWERIRDMNNPVGYLYVVGRDRGRRSRRRERPAFYEVNPERSPWVEPGLPAAIAHLPDRQREVVVLLHCFDWTMSEVGGLLDLSKATVQKHAERGLASLRSSMGAES